ncbi:hypothetical protein BOX15_Mlig028156g2, partial [Macrostomum lignano]
SSNYSEQNVFLFVPNLIGYARILLAILACYYMPFDHVRATWAYLLSGLLDAFDGHAARLLNQSTKFGAMLDMLTDRCATMCLLFVLAQFYPRYMLAFQLSAALDIASHWLHLHSSIVRGAQSHKAVDLSSNPILYYYYNSRVVLFCMCAGNELFYAALYLMHFTRGPILLGFGLVPTLAVLTFPVAAVKSAISAVHLYVASVNMAALDTKERAEQAAGANKRE